MVRDDAEVDPYSETAASVEERERGGSAAAGAGAAAVGATVAARPGNRPRPAPDGTATDARQHRPREPEDDDLTGARLAHFRVDRLLGKGGMGAVYLATDLALDRPVALKFLPREIARDPALKERFYREARAQARIAHPNVCHIYFIGEQDEQLFFAMEYVDGESLQDRIDREGRLAPADAVEYCRMAALGLREAHRHGFTHRDIKPSNLMIDRHGTVKVVDFGIVKKAPEDGDAAITSEGGGLIGTPLYMAPEQAKGETVDLRADMYALGATLHHLISGQPPFTGDTPLSVVSRHLGEPRPRLDVRGGRRRARAALDELCDRMMAKHPADRFASYDDLLDAFERVSPDRARPAGFFVRAFAGALDLFALVLALIPVGLAFALVFGEGNVDVDGKMMMMGAVPYVVACHARWGRTLGKLALEIRVVPQEGVGRVGWRRAALRYLAQWGHVYVTLGVASILARTAEPPEWTIVTFLLAAFAVTVGGGVFGVLLSPAKRTLWDRAAGTEVRYDNRPRPP